MMSQSCLFTNPSYFIASLSPHFECEFFLPRVFDALTKFLHLSVKKASKGVGKYLSNPASSRFPWCHLLLVGSISSSKSKRVASHLSLPGQVPYINTVQKHWSFYTKAYSSDCFRKDVCCAHAGASLVFRDSLKSSTVGWAFYQSLYFLLLPKLHGT